jgi:hypothetical protein
MAAHVRDSVAQLTASPSAPVIAVDMDDVLCQTHLVAAQRDKAI